MTDEQSLTRPSGDAGATTAAAQSRELSNLARELQDWRRRALRAEAEVTQLRASRSFRLTRPIRDAALRARGAKQQWRELSFRMASTFRRSPKSASVYDPIDWSWYLRTNPDVASAGVAPATHYATAGWREGRWPVPWFDPEKHGQGNAGRDPFAAYLSAKHRRALVERVGEAPSAALSVHVFYADYLDRFRRRIERLDVPINVYVTTPEGFDTSWHQEWRDLASVRSMDVKSCPNVGRNFGPMLVEFSQSLGKHDFLLHAHSKKSLRTGTNQDDWAQECLDAALPRDGRLRERLQALCLDDGLGGIRPGVSKHLPFWANHWLQNVHEANRLGILSRPAEHSFLEYPVGGMFTVKTASVTALLQRRWSYSDFPAEYGQSDGTAQHAIERVIGALVIQGDQHLGVAWGHDQTPVREHVLSESDRACEAAMSQGQLLSPVRLVSFDFFDTLFERTGLETEQAKWSVGAWLAGQGVCSQTEYVEVRDEVEAFLRDALGPYEDVTLTSVARVVANRLHREDLAEELRAREVSAECDLLRPRTGVWDLYRQRVKLGLPAVVVSDTYYARDDLFRMLEAHGLHVDRADILASSSTGRRKDRGDVWDIVQERAAPLRGGLVHVGDNVVSDVQMCSDRGIAYVYTPNARDAWYLTTGRLIPRLAVGSSQVSSGERLLASYVGQRRLAALQQGVAAP